MYFFMANSSGTHSRGFTASYNDSSVHEERRMPSFLHQQTISIDWSPNEEAVLQEGLVKYATESSVTRYVKIGAQLKDKTVRDVALRCRWMTKKETSKRRKDDINGRRSKDRKASQAQGI